ncbi:uncharacterized protein LOC115343996 [Aquila chrysaetos chrysaetos]|uniref:uncharacterized protein LOC115343996 n=1 Tax=Aquila chrysaetos chrysaetos TaxID=223781 RepID=UPI0011773196|nr:uncharacterized protein LOC115343996 [Aquila chrysaetos chrysaetos]
MPFQSVIPSNNEIISKALRFQRLTPLFSNTVTDSTLPPQRLGAAAPKPCRDTFPTWIAVFCISRHFMPQEASDRFACSNGKAAGGTGTGTGTTAGTAATAPRAHLPAVRKPEAARRGALPARPRAARREGSEGGRWGRGRAGRPPQAPVTRRAAALSRPSRPESQCPRVGPRMVGNQERAGFPRHRGRCCQSFGRRRRKKWLAHGDKFAAYVTLGGFVCEEEEGDM